MQTNNQTTEWKTSAPALFIAGEWRESSNGETLEVQNPATEARIADLPVATMQDLDAALQSASRGFHSWSLRSAMERSEILRTGARLLRERADSIARILTLEQGKPFAEAKGEVSNGADILEWYADEGRRAYGRVIPSRTPGATALATREPVGPVAAFSPWNFPVSQAARKLGAALSSGCTIILKGPEEAPSAVCELVRALADGGVPAGTLNLVFGRPDDISRHLIPAPEIRKVSFTGSVPVGKHLAAMAAGHMKPATMELGGHSPVIVFDDADVDAAAVLLAAFKHRNAGQVCIAPTRFFIQDNVYDVFVSRYLERCAAIKVGSGSDPATTMGPLATMRRMEAVSDLVTQAQKDGAQLLTGGERLGNVGYFYAPTVLSSIPADSRIMNEEPFGPVTLINRFSSDDDGLRMANSSSYGLAAYGFTASGKRAARLSKELRTGMVTINHLGLGPVETPFGGVLDSGYGREGGPEGLDAYLVTKFTSQIFP